MAFADNGSNADGARRAPGVTLVDARSGRRLASWLEGRLHSSQEAGFLGDGRVAVVDAPDGAARLRLFGRDGEPEASWPLGPAAFACLGSELRAGQLFVGLEGTAEAPPTVLLVDLADGHILHREAGLRPIGRPTASPTATLFLDTQGALVRLDPRTGARQALLTPRR